MRGESAPRGFLKNNEMAVVGGVGGGGGWVQLRCWWCDASAKSTGAKIPPVPPAQSDRCVTNRATIIKSSESSLKMKIIEGYRCWKLKAMLCSSSQNKSCIVIRALVVEMAVHLHTGIHRHLSNWCSVTMCTQEARFWSGNARVGE